MNAILQTQSSCEVRLEALTFAQLDAVCAIENLAYSDPWSRANFGDSLRVGNCCRTLMAGSALLGYFVAMKGVEEVHLLNLTVAPAYQRQGWAALMLEALRLWSRAQGARWVWLEVRTSNARALAVYERHGFHRAGMRKGYYPALNGAREDAVLMSLPLDDALAAGGGAQ
ncbi:MAG: ribosomal protein S18-alanine N-acetyltransferase [Burkholderiaceae bacterium]|jgi:ribosomal-protein-alanine N-acetyltransferase|nr:ribosomal protein S18-alanine N-acetyltransferase [Burkholderiaceae bacterium]